MKGVLLLMVVYHCQSGFGQPRLAEPMEIAALGRSFSLGALYDVRTEHLSPLKLWKQATLEQNKHVTHCPFLCHHAWTQWYGWGSSEGAE